ncbi:hypothetical protein [Nonomuraea ferruginea]|uniref:Uncharacterized protein n=1 Tax=Nonomuraea ferruginea TaxID=46174 RepID=A0ABT4SX30_9ACTN|nr:hypothetical protein [Nonomuraea ferruginea]MDA0641665.1 hypothetical protein [Nonomuraea ferruginea]
MSAHTMTDAVLDVRIMTVRSARSGVDILLADWSGVLLPHLLAAPDPRVVTVSSGGQRFARFDLENLNAERRYRTAFAYVQSKRANLYFAVELQRRADAARLKLRSMAVAPGLTRTNVLTGGADGSRERLHATRTRLLVRVAFLPTLEGAKTSLYAATVPDLPGGSYIVPDGPLQLRGEPTPRTRERAIHDTATAAHLWRLRTADRRHLCPVRRHSDPPAVVFNAVEYAYRTSSPGQLRRTPEGRRWA